jgi:hypothetical protein
MYTVRSPRLSPIIAIMVVVVVFDREEGMQQLRISFADCLQMLENPCIAGDKGPNLWEQS